MATKEKWAKTFETWHQYMDDVNIYFGTDKDATIDWNSSNSELTFTGATQFTGAMQIAGTVTVTGGVTWTGAVDVVLTAPATADDAFYGLINASAAYALGNMVGIRGNVVLSGTTNFVSATGVWAGLDFSTKTGSGSGLTCAINAEVTSDNATAPNAIIYIQSLPNGASADFSNVPYIAFTEYVASGTGSNYLFSLGHQPAGSGRNVTSGDGKLFDTTTLKIEVNGSDRFIPLSTVKNAFTTAAAISCTGLTFSATSDIVIPAATDSALEISDGITKILDIDTRVITSAAPMFTFTCAPATFVAASGSHRRTVSIAPGTTTLTGSTGTTDMGGCGLYVSAPTLTNSTGQTVTRASTVLIEGMPVEGGSCTITYPYALRVTGTTASDSRNSLVEFNQTIGASAAGQSMAGLRIYNQTDDTAGRVVGNMYGARIECSQKHVADQVTGLMTGLQIVVDTDVSATAGTVYGLDIVMEESNTRARQIMSFISLNDKDYAGAYPVSYLFDFGGGGNYLSTGSGKIYHEETLKIRVNQTNKYIPLSTTEGTYTTAYPVNLNYNGASLNIASTPTAAAVAQTITITDTCTASSGRGIGLFVDYTANGTHTNTYGVRSTRVNTTISANVPNWIAGDWYLAAISNLTIGYLMGLSMYWENYGNAIGYLAMLDLGMNSANACTGNRHTFIRCREHTGIVANSSVLRMEGSSAAKYLLWFDTGASGACEVIVASGGHGTSPDLKILCYIEGVGDRYIELHP